MIEVDRFSLLKILVAITIIRRLMTNYTQHQKRALDELTAVVTPIRDRLGAGYTESALKAMDEDLRQALAALEDAILKPHKIPNKTRVVHYTSVGVINSILGRLRTEKNVSLRAYDTVHVNDPTEGRYFLDLFPYNVPWMRGKDVLHYSASHAYVTSFVVDKTGDTHNRLEFWRAYGDEGQGCSLSFLVSEQHPTLWSVTYDRRNMQPTVDIIVNAINQLKSLATAVRAQTRRRVEQRLKEMVWRVLNRIRYLYKSNAFAYEEECRFVPPIEQVENDVRFEYDDKGDRSPRIRHYVEHRELDIRARVLATDSRIMLGPTLYRADNVKYYFDRTIKNVALPTCVEVSRLPYQKP